MKDLNYNGFIIHRVLESGWVNLTDMWKAAGSPGTKRVNDWLNNQDTQNLVLVMAQKLNTTPSCIYVTRRGRGGGTYGTPDLAIAYAQKLSTEFHAWALAAIRERIEEEANPELAYSRGRERAVKGWKRKGKTDDWIQDRINGIENYKQHTTVLATHGVKNQGRSNGYAACANAINIEVLGGTSRDIKIELEIKEKARLRDNLSRLRLTGLSFAEAMADEDIESKNLQGNSECRQACSKAGLRVASAANYSTRLINKPIDFSE